MDQLTISKTTISEAVSASTKEADQDLMKLSYAVIAFQASVTKIDEKIAELNLRIAKVQEMPPSHDEFVAHVMATVREQAQEWQDSVIEQLGDMPACRLEKMEVVQGYDGAGREIVSRSSVFPINPAAVRFSSSTRGAAHAIWDARRHEGLLPSALFAMFGTLLVPEFEKWISKLDLGLPKKAEIPLAQRDGEMKRLRAERNALEARRAEITKRIEIIREVPARLSAHIHECPPGMISAMAQRDAAESTVENSSPFLANNYGK